MNQDELQNTVLCGDALEMLKRLLPLVCDTSKTFLTL